MSRAGRFPERIGAYVPERLIGRGAMAAVYLCRDDAGRPVAIKWMEMAHGPLVARFAREVEVLERIKHPGIVRVEGHGEQGGRPYLVMEYVDGQDLRLYSAKLHKRPSSERYARCRTIGQALCEALQHLHDVDLVHRDLKPSNVVVASNGRVVLTDFGVVKDLRQPDRTAVGQMVGTMSYAAPEQLEGESLDGRTDLYGLGGTLYFVLTRRRPFEGLTRGPAALVPPPSRFDPEIPPDLESVVLRLLAIEPADRFQTATSVHNSLSTEDTAGTALAGTGRVLDLVTKCLNRAALGEPLLVRPTGPMGTRKAWVGDLLREGAQRRGVAVAEVIEEGAVQAVLERLNAGEPLLVISPLDLPVPEGVARVEIPLEPLGLADIRRSLVAVGPLTQEPAVAAARLQRLTGGLPRLLLAMFDKHVRGGALDLPEPVPAPSVVDDFLAGLDLDDLEVLGVLAAVDRPIPFALIEDVANVPAEATLERLQGRGIVRPVADRYTITADLFRQVALSRMADPDGLCARAAAAIVAHEDAVHGSGGRLGDGVPATLDEVADQLMAGHLAQALNGARKAVAVAQGIGEPVLECRATVVLGEVLLRLGQTDLAGRRLADATALARASGLEALRRRCHALRAWAALDAHRGGRTAAAAAVDRVLPLLTGAHDRGANSTDAELAATWARAAAVLGDRRSWERARSAALSWAQTLDEPARLAVGLQLARGALSLGDSFDVHELLAPFGSLEGRYPLMVWEAARISAALNDEPMPAPGAFVEGLAPEDLAGLVGRKP